jgi:H+-translocating NAD(P) transhydrogenase subunit alpha
MKIGLPAETKAGETRVAATPETIKKLIAQKHDVFVQAGAGLASSIPDTAFEAVGAKVVGTAQQVLSQAEIILKVRAPQVDELAMYRTGQVLVGMLNPFDGEGLAALNQAGLTAFALEAAPRTTRAQSMDVLSSQANIAGYKAVMIAANEYQRFMPMLMTAAGTVKAARVLILGVGVAGLQAIATAKRLGAVIEASDVRPATKEQVESLGAKFVDVPFETEEEREIAQGVGGYARPMPQAWMQRQAAAVHERAKQADIVITTALIPGRKAPVLLHENTVAEMKPGAVIVDLAVEQGGNCPLSRLNEVVLTPNGVKIVGYPNLATQVAADASSLYARNVLDFLKLIVNSDGQFILNLEDDIVAATLMCCGGELKRKN